MRHELKAGASALIFALMAGPVPAWADFWSDAGAKFEGVTLHGVTESTPPSNYIKDVLAPEFEEKTGIKVEIETTSWDQMYDKAIKDMEAQTGIYDMVYIEQDIIYAYLARNFLVDITKALKDDPSLKAPDFSEEAFTTFANYFKNADGDLFGVPMEAFIKIYLYRTDLFNDPEVQAAFKEKTGRDLAPATNHEEYTEIAEFFTAWGQEKGEELWGTTAQAHTGHPASWYEFFESIAPTFGVYNWGINPAENFAASVANGGTMNSDEAKAALKYWLHLRDIAPPKSAASTWTEVGTTFAAGRAAQGLVYGENAAWIASDPEKSRVVDKVGVALPPTEPGVLEAAEAGEGYIGYYDGGAFGLPVTSKNQEAALLFLQYIGQELGAAGLGGRRAAHHQRGDLRRPGRHGNGREARRLLHDAQGPGEAFRRRPALPVPRPGPRGDGAGLLRDPDRRRGARRRPRPDGSRGRAGTDQPRLPQVTR